MHEGPTCRRRAKVGLDQTSEAGNSRRSLEVQCALMPDVSCGAREDDETNACHRDRDRGALGNGRRDARASQYSASASVTAHARTPIIVTQRTV